MVGLEGRGQALLLALGLALVGVSQEGRKENNSGGKQTRLRPRSTATATATLEAETHGRHPGVKTEAAITTANDPHRCHPPRLGTLCACTASKCV